MGEIGIPRREFLYDLEFWEVKRIIRGFRKRDRLKLQLLRLTSYFSCFAMRDAKGKSPDEWLHIPLLDDDDENGKQLPSNEEVEDIQDMLRSINGR